MESTAYSIAEICRPHTPFSRSMLYEQIKAGRLTARKLGRKTVILARDYEAWLASLPPAVTKAGGRSSYIQAARSTDASNSSHDGSNLLHQAQNDLLCGNGQQTVRRSPSKHE
jgi:hypothetical protein